jgi:hypothetical protein
LLARDLGFLDDKKDKSLESTVVEIKRMLAALIQKLRSMVAAGN